jgi:hypothetical protein
MEDWDQRLLCPDGACVGTIGDSGTCTVCGRVAPNWGEERKRGLIEDTASDDEDEDEVEDDDDEAAEDSADADLLPETPSLLGEAAEWDKRALCPDGGCVGVIDPGTKRCSVCNRAAA